MKYLTVCQGALLALSLTVASTSAFAGDYGGGPVAGGYGGRDCYKCPPPRNYDSQEVVKQTRDVDHSNPEKRAQGRVATVVTMPDEYTSAIAFTLSELETLI